jgi:adenosylcobyric acid synthase
MLAERIDDPVESRAGMVAGLGLLPVTVTFSADKRLGRPQGCWLGHPVGAYEIHHGVVQRSRPEGAAMEPFLDGWHQAGLWGTTWHGAWENDGFRRAWLAEVAHQAGVAWQPLPHAPGFADQRAAMLDRLGDAIEEHVDTKALWQFIEQGVPPGLPTISSTSAPAAAVA